MKANNKNKTIYQLAVFSLVIALLFIAGSYAQGDTTDPTVGVPGTTNTGATVPDPTPPPATAPDPTPPLTTVPDVVDPVADTTNIDTNIEPVVTDAGVTTETEPTTETDDPTATVDVVNIDTVVPPTSDQETEGTLSTPEAVMEAAREAVERTTREAAGARLQPSRVDETEVRVVDERPVTESVRISEEENRSVTTTELRARMSKTETVVPIVEEEANIRIITTEERETADEHGVITRELPFAIMIDTDRDGLSDDMEDRLGTDPLIADTDSDGVSDGVEVRENKNPIGSGVSEIKLAPIDKAILQNRPLESPKTRGVVSEYLLVEKIQNIEEAEVGTELKEGYVFSGKALPNSTITLYIYSELPIVVTVQADEYGNWEYKLNKSLVDGEHEIYAVVNDDTGKVVEKSNPINFFIKEAQAASLDDFLGETEKESESSTRLYIIIALFVVAAGISLFVIGAVSYRKKQTIN